MVSTSCINKKIKTGGRSQRRVCVCWCVCVSPHGDSDFSALQELEQQFEKERLTLEKQKVLLRQQLDELKEELNSKLTAASEEVGEQSRNNDSK